MARPKGCPSVTILICALNEEENLPQVLPKIPNWVSEVLLVDGHSKDKTVEVAQQLCPVIHIISQPGKGKGDALKYGVAQASGEIIVTLDADGQTSPEDIDRFIEPLIKGYDLVKGSRLVHGKPVSMSRFRWVGNKVLAITSNVLFGTKYTDICSGYNAFRKSAFLSLNLTCDGFEMEQQMLVKAKKAGLKVAEVSHQDHGRLDSNSKVSATKQGFHDWFVVIRERFRHY